MRPRLPGNHKKAPPNTLFGRWLTTEVTRYIGIRHKTLCRCTCGTETFVRTDGLINGHSKSCGCLKVEKVTKKSTKHGFTKYPEYGCWRTMISRCSDPTNPNWPRYGERGIKVAAEFMDFLTFLDHIGPRPSRKHSIGRIDNNGDYERGNVRWETMVEQSNNRTTSRFITVNGIRDTIANHAIKVGLHPGIVSDRLRNGWSECKAVNTPIDLSKVHRGFPQTAERYEYFSSRKTAA